MKGRPVLFKYIPHHKCYLRDVTDIRVWALDVYAETLCQLRRVKLAIIRHSITSCVSFHQTISRMLRHSSCNLQCKRMRYTH